LLFVLLILGSLWETCSPVRAVPTPAWQRKAREHVITLNDKTTKLQTKNMQTANHKQKGDELLHYHPPLLQGWGPRLKPTFKNTSLAEVTTYFCWKQCKSCTFHLKLLANIGAEYSAWILRMLMHAYPGHCITPPAELSRTF